MIQHTLRILTIGAGAIGRHMFSDMARYPRHEQISLSFADPSPAAREAVRRELPQAAVYETAQEMLAAPAGPTDVVYISTPPAFRFEAAMLALRSGRHILCEKPFMMTVEQARTVLEEARRRGLTVGCCSSRFRRTPTTLFVKKLLEEGRLGNLYHVHFVHKHVRHRTGIEWQPASRWFLDSSKNGGGVGMDWGPYDFSNFSHLFAPVKVEVLHCQMNQPDTWLEFGPEVVNTAEQHILATMRFTDATGAAFLMTYERAACVHGQEEVYMEAHGSKGGARWDWWFYGDRSVTVYGDDMGRQTRETKVLPAEAQDGTDGFCPVGFLRHVLGDRQANVVINDEAVFNFACVRALYNAAGTGKPQVVTQP